jgi:hypothetical protein
LGRGIRGRLVGLVAHAIPALVGEIPFVSRQPACARRPGAQGALTHKTEFEDTPCWRHAHVKVCVA